MRYLFKSLKIFRRSIFLLSPLFFVSSAFYLMKHAMFPFSF